MTDRTRNLTFDMTQKMLLEENLGPEDRQVPALTAGTAFCIKVSHPIMRYKDDDNVPS